MLTSLFGRCIGVSTVVCVLLMFFFPLPHGNFQSTHGPTTALRSKRALVALVLTIITAALRTFAALIPCAFPSFRSRSRTSRQEVTTGTVANCNAVLRC
ncbi:MAG TPA: hypothetical protein VJA94_23940 [Candidatus Angelobacter sp.]